MGSLAGAEPSRKERRNEARELTRAALQKELDGESKEAATALERALLLDPSNKAARWRLGYVEPSGDWIRYDERPALRSQRRTFLAYLHRRAEAVDTAAGQWALAQWCGKEGLADRQRAHAHAVLIHDPDHHAARALRGDQWIGDRWVSAKELAARRPRVVQGRGNRGVGVQARPRNHGASAGGCEKIASWR